MWYKHAVWCQCASTTTAVLTIATFVSMRSFSVGVDLYWTLILGIQCVVQFFAAEHQHIGITPSQWHQIEERRSYASKWLLVGWSLVHWSTWNCAIITTLAGASTRIPWRFRKKIHIYIIPVASLLLFLYAPTYIDRWIRFVPWILCQRIRRGIPLKNTSTADMAIRRHYFWRAMAILTESYVYWSFRCLHRFPHRMRWSSLIMAHSATVMALIWCHYNVAPTRVSSNSIIQREDPSHWMAASVVSAKKCPMCASRLTALDVESSFGEKMNM